MPDGRKTPRIPFTEGLHLRTTHAFTGHGVDISAGGIGVWVQEPVEAGTAIEVELFQGLASVLGTVRWCRPDGEGHRIGVEFREEDWSVFELVQQYAREPAENG